MGWVKVGTRSVSLTVEKVQVRAKIISWNVSVSPTSVNPGQDVTVMITAAAGDGDLPARCYAVIHWIDGRTYQTDEFTVSPNTSGMATTKLTVERDQAPGTYTVTVDLYEWVD